MEYMAGGQLFEVINGIEPLSEANVALIMAQLL